MQSDSFRNNEKASNAILVFLLIFRLTDHYLLTWIFGTTLPDWAPYWYAGIAYIMTVVLITLNRHRLSQLNIDRPFIIVLILGGLLYVFLRANVGIFVAVATAFVYWVYINHLFVLKKAVDSPPGTMLLTLILVPLAILPLILFGYSLRGSPSFQHLYSAFFNAQLGFILFEEVLFRGALWAYLRDLGLKERIAFFVQVFLFWMAHSRFLSLETGYSFWVATPLVSLLLGLLAWRSRSITPSTIGHYLYNFTINLIKQLV